MNLYLITTKISVGCDAYDSAVVAAATAEDARLVHPNPNNYYREGKWLMRIIDWEIDQHGGWVHPDDVDVELLGILSPSRGSGVILSSFNAG